MDSENYSSSLQPEDVLGEGTYGTVFKGYTKDKENTPVALKQIRNDSRAFTKSAKTDLTALLAVSGHKNIVRLLAFHTDNHFIYIIMELCSGDLSQYLSKGIPGYRVKLEIMKQCAQGITYIHTLDPPVVHRDIKTQNILLQELHTGIRIKIADFGLAKVFDKIGRTLNSMIMTTNVGSMPFRAPELWKIIDPLQYTAKIDNYALGLVFAILLNFGEDETSLEPYIADIPREPYLALGMGQLHAYNSNKPLPRLFFTPAVERNHPRMKSLIEGMITLDANERMEIPTVKASIKNEMLRLNEEETSKRCEVEFSQQIEALEVKHDQDIATLKWNHDTKYNSVKDECEALQETHQKEIENKSRLEIENLEITSEYSRLKDECEALQKTHQKEMETKTRLQIENIEITTELEKKLEKETLQHEDKYSALKANYERELHTKSKLESDIKMHQTGNSLLQEEFAALQKKYEQEEQARKVIRTEYKDLQKKYIRENEASKHLRTQLLESRQAAAAVSVNPSTSSQRPGSYRRTDQCLRKIKGLTPIKVQSFHVNSDCLRFSCNINSNMFYFPHPDDNCISCYTTTGECVKTINLDKYKIERPRSVHPLTGDTVLVAAKNGLYLIGTGEGEGVGFCVHKGDCEDVTVYKEVVAVFVDEHTWCGRGKVYLYDSSDLGKLKSSIKLTHTIDYMCIQSILINDDVLYMCSASDHNITTYNIEKGKMITQYGRPGREAPGELNVPHLSVCDTEGSLLVVDEVSQPLQTLTARGEWAVLPGLGEVEYPRDALIIDDQMYILARGNIIHVFKIT